MRFFIIPGEPVAKARPRVTKNGAFTPDKTKNYETLVKELYFYEHGKKPMLEGMLSIEISAYFAIPKSANGSKKKAMIDGKVRPVKRPDIDNVIKSITDALNNIAYNDDSQIVSVLAEKYYSDKPRVEIRLLETEDSHGKNKIRLDSD